MWPINPSGLPGSSATNETRDLPAARRRSTSRASTSPPNASVWIRWMPSASSGRSFRVNASRSSRHRVVVLLSFVSSWSCLRGMSSWCRERGRRFRLPAAGAHPSRFKCPTLFASSHTRPQQLRTSLLRLHFHVSSDSALRTTTAARTRLPCRRSRRPHGEVTKSSRRRVPWRHRVVFASCLRGVSSWSGLRGYGASRYSEVSVPMYSAPSLPSATTRTGPI